MAIKKPIEDLPRAAKSAGFPPAKNNFVAEAIAQVWYEIYTGKRDPITVPLELGQGDNKPHRIPEAGPYRASMAGTRCDRAVYYQMNGTEASNPPTIADSWRMALGTLVHDVTEAIADLLFEHSDDITDVITEPEVDLRKIGINGSGSGDIVITYKGVRTAIEMKTTGGFKFKLAATTFKGPPEGASYGHIVQGAMAAKVLEADNLVIAYMSMENVSPKLAEQYASSEAGRFAAEWHYKVDALNELIGAEIDRAHMIESYVDDPEKGVPDRELRDPEYPIGATVQSPKTGAWTVTAEDGDSVIDTGTTWMCDYCRHRDTCIKDGQE